MKRAKTSFLEKEMDLDALQKQVAAWRSENLSICFTNGCFDILHLGHVTYIEKASEHADRMIIGINSDRSVKALDKAPERPINGESSRAKIIAALDAVDAVVVFDEDTPERLISTIMPDVLVKGGDYDPNETDPSKKTYMVGSTEVRASGGEVIAIPLVDGFSTTNIVRRMRD